MASVNLPWKALGYLTASCIAVVIAGSIPYPTQAQLAALNLVSAVAIGSLTLQVPSGAKLLPATLKAAAVVGGSVIGFQAPSEVGPIIREVFHTPIQQNSSCGAIEPVDLLAFGGIHNDAGIVNFAEFSPDGIHILTASDDGTARLWDALTGEPIGDPMRHDDAVRDVAFDPRGRFVVTGSDDKTARLWDARTGKPIGGSMQHNGAVPAVAVAPDGRVVVTGSDDKTARLWDART